MNIPVPTLILRSALFVSYAPQYLCFAKIDSRLKDSRRPLLTHAIHTAITPHVAAHVRTVIAAGYVAIRANAAVETGGIAADVGRGNVAANV